MRGEGWGGGVTCVVCECVRQTRKWWVRFCVRKIVSEGSKNQENQGMRGWLSCAKVSTNREPLNETCSWLTHVNDAPFAFSFSIFYFLFCFPLRTTRPHFLFFWGFAKSSLDTNFDHSVSIQKHGLYAPMQHETVGPFTQISWPSFNLTHPQKQKKRKK